MGRVTCLLLLTVKRKRLVRLLRLRMRSSLKSRRRRRALLLVLPCRRHIEMIAAVMVVAATAVQFT